MMDVVIPYRRSFSKELIYALRSIDQNLPHRNVYIIGDDTPELAIENIQFQQSSDIARNTADIITLACNNPDISDDFIYTHDDIFVMNPIAKIPIHYKTTFRELLSDVKKPNDYYTKRAIKTYQKLRELGISEPLCYELHIPFVINKKKWLETAETAGYQFNKTSIYGNLHEIGGTQLKDPKVFRTDWLPSGDFISTHEATFDKFQAGRIIRSRFAERCRYER